MGFSLGRFMQGVGQVAVPAALEEHKARIMAKRDEALFGKEKELQGIKHEQAKELAGMDAQGRMAATAYEQAREDARLASDPKTKTANRILELVDKLDSAQDEERSSIVEQIVALNGDLKTDAEIASSGSADRKNWSPERRLAEDLVLIDPSKYPDVSKAWEAVQDYKLTAEALRYVSEQLELQEMQGPYPGEPGYKTPEQMLIQARKIFQSNKEEPEPAKTDPLGIFPILQGDSQ